MKPDQYPSLACAQKIAEETLGGGVFVEIGTWEGDFSYALLKHTKCKKLYCIDPYKHFEDESYPDGMNELSQAQFDKKYETARARFAEFGDRVEFLRMTSLEAAARFADGTVDYVYIDGNHDYSFVLLDIITWWPKVRAGGWLTGDDVYSTDLAEHDSDGNVKRVWGPGCWGKYGTYKAAVDAAATCGFTFKVDQTQFLAQRPAPSKV